MKYVLSLVFVALVFQACNNNNNKIKSDNSDNQWQKDSLAMDSMYGPKYATEGILDSILPFFAKVHDSIPKAKKFDKVFKPYFDLHKQERKYRMMYYAMGKDSSMYFMVSRSEPSIKNNKFAAVCGKFKLNSTGNIDTSTYEELFWTWKMLLPILHKKSAELFKVAVNQGSLKPYLPSSTKVEYIMFPDGNAYFDKTSKTWKTGNGL